MNLKVSHPRWSSQYFKTANIIMTQQSRMTFIIFINIDVSDTVWYL